MFILLNILCLVLLLCIPLLILDHCSGLASTDDHSPLLAIFDMFCGTKCCMHFMYLAGEVCGMGCYGGSLFCRPRHPGNQESEPSAELYNATPHRGFQRYIT